MRPAKWTKNCGVIRQKRPHRATSLPCVPRFIVEINETNRRKKKELDRERQMVVLAGGYLDQLSEECKGSSLHQLQLVKNEVFPSFGTVQSKS